jgi:3-methyladenine DNA glycosylase AlkD
LACNIDTVPPMPILRVETLTVSPHDLVVEMRNRLAESADSQKAPRMQAYMKSALPFLGVSAVPMRRTCRTMFDQRRLPDRDAWRSAVLLLWDDARFREERYAALELTGHRHYRGFQDAAALDLYRHLVVTGAWWDHVDAIASARIGPILRAHHAETAPTLRGWAEDEDLWVRRAAILCQLGSKTDTDLDLLTHAIERNLDASRHGREFFIRKAIGWALREYAKTDEAWVVTFVDDHHHSMSALSRREALKNVSTPTG